MGGWRRLGNVRKALIAASAVAACGVLASDAAVLAYLDKYHVHGGPIRGASGWTMFAAVISLLILPLLLTRWARVQRRINRTGVELALLALLALLFFIAGIVLATRARPARCVIGALCTRIRVATAFAWLAFGVLVAALATVALVARVQARLGLPLFSAYSFDVEGDELVSPPPIHDMHAAAVNIAGAQMQQQQQQQAGPFAKA
ncbi:hypothetical protein LPJ72_004015 [Coemansia sp. Benny D160-2]|nr:hypothetical protein LPJ72_004015 [Coemansia sp. Benny D160-2]